MDGEKAEATVKFYGYPNVESKPLSDLTPLRPAPGGELAPGQATVGFECEVRGPSCRSFVTRETSRHEGAGID